jgi:tetratricopeptide (TPR) repeat protein
MYVLSVGPARGAGQAMCYHPWMVVRQSAARAKGGEGRSSGSEELAAKGERELIVGRYRIEAPLGAGGMGAVYRVLDESTGRALALKRFGGPAAVSNIERHDLRFRREFHTIARLRHPRIVEAHEYGVDRGSPFYTMELLDGHDLGEVGKLETARACELLRDVASALSFLHARRLIHRDLAPRNVRCTSDGRAKLIDFGVLATTGHAGDIAGTAPFISPENVRGLPIDHRADLFGLGALAYWLVTGFQAYPARNIEQLEELWRSRPHAPSQYSPSVPKALDELILSLLSLDPLGRPGTAAETMDRLQAIAGLDPLPDVEVARGYLASAAMVGRKSEMDAIRRRIGKAALGEGGAVVLEAPSGRGKSRLLREIALEAQVAGATVLSADSDSAGRGPYGLLRALARAMLTSAPADAMKAAVLRAPVLARAIPELHDRLDFIPLAPITGGPEEERMRVQAELSAWFLDVCAERTLVFLVDDLQRADEASCAVLATLTHEAIKRRLLLVVALRTDEAIHASAAVTTIREASHRMRVRALEAADVEELVQGMFGEVPRIARLATWMQQVAGGSPLHCMELARHLVEQKVIRYEGSLWSVPDELKLEGMPKRLADAMEARIRTLGPSARALSEALSVHGGELPLAVCVAIADLPDERQVFHALDELVYEEVLVGANERYRFRHDGLREALLRSSDPDRIQALHLRVGEALAHDGTVLPEREAEIGWHLLRGGQRRRGAELLWRAGDRLYKAQSFRDAVAPLEAALEVYEEGGYSPKTILEIRHMLVMVGFFSDRLVTLRYADATLEQLRTYAGMNTAARLSRYVPRLIALVFGLLLATMRWLLTRPGRRGPTPVAAMHTFYIEVVYVTAARSFSFHLDEVRAHIASLEAFNIGLLRRRVPNGAYLYTKSLLAMPLGRFVEGLTIADEIKYILDYDHLTPISDIDRNAALGGALYIRAIIPAMRQDPKCLDEVGALEALDQRYFEVSACLCRIVFRRFRGEEDVAREIEARTDLLLVQAGSMWGPESQIVWMSALAYGLTRDVLGLRRTITDLTRLIESGYRLTENLELARGEYLRERGELAASREALEHALSLVTDDEVQIRMPALGALAETFLAMQEPAKAEVAAKEALAVCRDKGVLDVTWRMRATRALAMAEAAQGDVETATRRLDAAITEALPYGSPTLSGSLHEGRAKIALSMDDVEAYALHRNGTESWFRATKNPALIARIERLPDPATLHSAPSLDGAQATVVASPGGRHEVLQTIITGDVATLASANEVARWVTAMLSGCRGRLERASRSLELLVEAASGLMGYIYLYQHGELQLLAPTYGEEPPDALVSSLTVALGDTQSGHVAQTMEVAWKPDAAPGDVTWVRAVLTVARGGHPVPLGVVAIVCDAAKTTLPPAGLIEQVALELCQAGDVSFGSGAISTSISGEKGLPAPAARRTP